MKRYLIFGAIGPFIGGFLMLFATTVASGYWHDTNWSEIGKFLGAFVKTLQYSYLFGIVPALMVGAIDDILYHIKRIAPVVRMLIVSAIGFRRFVLALWFARAGYRHDAVFALRPRRHGARDAVVLAGAQICRHAANGAFDVRFCRDPPFALRTAVIVREGGRSSIPEASANERIVRGVLDPRLRGDDNGACCARNDHKTKTADLSIRRS